ncbi:NapC/NirT family cytochrome c [candidate division KSB1 bacterium]
MVQRYIQFLRGVSSNTVGKTGVVFITSSVVSFFIFEIAMISGVFTNAYIGLISYLLFPTLFIIGLILVPVGWFKHKNETGLSTEELLKHDFHLTYIKGGIFGSNVFLIILILTAANVVFLVGLSTQMLHFMDQSEFCGTACHSVMGPEWASYQKSPHARVPCVECHVGEGVDALINAKLNGVWQIISSSFNLYSRPIPTPVHQLRPAPETCEKCHWPDKFYGSHMKNLIRYQMDEQSTPTYTTLNLKIDAGIGSNESGIHWHIAEENEVRYVSVYDERIKMIWVEVRQPDGTFRRFTNDRLMKYYSDELEVRSLDCVDCHNRATHIYQVPEIAVDELIEKELVDRLLPYIKREGLTAITRNYPDKEKGLQGVERHIREFYQRKYPDTYEAKTDQIDMAIRSLQEAYDRNIHQTMNIRWGAYKSHLGHESTDEGCFRCHSQKLKDNEGNYISFECTLCHSILAFDEDDPYKYLLEVDPGQKNALMHEYLRNEFLQSRR